MIFIIDAIILLMKIAWLEWDTNSVVTVILFFLYESQQWVGNNFRYRKDN